LGPFTPTRTADTTAPPGQRTPTGAARCGSFAARCDRRGARGTGPARAVPASVPGPGRRASPGPADGVLPAVRTGVVQRELDPAHPAPAVLAAAFGLLLLPDGGAGLPVHLV